MARPLRVEYPGVLYYVISRCNNQTGYLWHLSQSNAAGSKLTPVLQGLREGWKLGHEVKHRNILYTGLPGCGKSTIIEKIVQRINRSSTGFFTREIRDKGRRVGFSITTLDGQQGILAHIDIRSHIRVGRYGVYIRDIEKIAVPSMRPENDNVILVVDEISKMECLSGLFRIPNVSEYLKLWGNIIFY